jgi:hypothetical protein
MEELHLADARWVSGGDAIAIAAPIRTFPVRLCELKEGYSEGVTEECIGRHSVLVCGIAPAGGDWAGEAG